MPDRPQEDPTASLDMPIDQARPEADRIAMEQARARAELALFGRASPARLGRYRILDRIAGGGMGVVYAAYDPELDRRVALKVVRPERSHDDRSRRRLVTEARALAKLDHPNVVKVHDVITIEGQVVIVMELVEGETLASWAAAASRSWREAVEVYLQAAEGLAAAHGVEVIHRDFKPSNAIIGVDGRVRVLDFGLARLTQTDEAAPDEATPDRSSSLTQTGDLLGTLGYSSPEQLRGETITAASDQYSLCLSLHQAVERVDPFSGTTVEARLASMETGRVRVGSADRSVPAWLRAIIARGLADSPAQRYPSIAELIADLRRPRGWPRWRVPALLAAIALLSVGITALVGGGSAHGDACDGGADQIAPVWNLAERDRLFQVLDGIGSPYAREVRDRAVSDLDRYARDWTAAHRSICRDHRRGVTSDALLDRRMICMSQRLGDLKAAVDVVGRTDLDSLARVMDVIARIPRISRCSDLEGLQAQVEPPDGPGARREVEAARARISMAEALSRAGRSEAARAAATQAAELARATGHVPAQVEAALAESRILMSQRDLRGAAVPLRFARAEALRLGMLPAAVEAAARLIYVEGMIAPDLDHLQRDVDLLIPLSASRECDHLARPLLLNNIGAVYLAAGRRAEALEYFGRAKRDLGSYAPVDLELTVIDSNLAMLTPDGAERTALAGAAWQRLRDALGAAHPSTLDALVVQSEYELDPAAAYALMSDASEGYHTFHPTLRRPMAVADAARAFLAAELGDRARAIADYGVAVSSAEGSSDPDVIALRRLAAGELALAQGDPSRAIEELTPVRDERAASDRWWERADGLRAQVGLGVAEAARGRDDEAIRHLEAAVAGYPAILAINEEARYRRLLARARHALAVVLRRTGRDPRRAAELERTARAFYETAGPRAYHWLSQTDPISWARE